ncbi:uncharacterized protein LOC113562551 [Ooceraea biroi]|uniref:uncharacterized protein LOC113562551 n=1 Tax=Ooceraea biroi TaxID=2015173 RepID=UPI000F077670|nr:uncharacterized protein LOC113562551 [Ooceraea biroi]
MILSSKLHKKERHQRIQHTLLHIFIIQVDIDDIEDDYFLRSILWTDECTFRSDGRINRQNEHHYAEENPHCRKETHVQGKFHVNPWMGIVDDMIIVPHFFPENINITVEEYSNFLEEQLPKEDVEKGRFFAYEWQVKFEFHKVMYTSNNTKTIVIFSRITGNIKKS